MTPQKKEEYLFRFQELLGAWKEVTWDSPLWAVYIFLKSIGLGFIYHLLFNLVTWVIKLGVQFFESRSIAQAQTTGADSLRVVVEQIANPIAWSWPSLSISYPLFIVAFAAGRTATRVGNVLGYLTGIIFLGVALAPELAQTSRVSELISISIFKIFVFAFGAWSTSSIGNPGAHRWQQYGEKTQGLFRYTLSGLRNQKEADAILLQLRQFVGSFNDCNVSDGSVIRLGKGNYVVSGVVSGWKYRLPKVRSSLEVLFPGKRIEATSIVETGKK